MKQSLNLKISQNLSLTPQLKQSLRILQLSALDLEQEIQQVLETNPLLERVESDQQANAEIDASLNTDPHDVPQPVAESADPANELERDESLQPEQNLDNNWQEQFESARTASQSASSSSSSRDDRGYEMSQTITRQETLAEHVAWQIQMTSLSDRDKEIANTLLHCLDEDGYLTVDGDEAAALCDPAMEVEADEVAALLSLIKTLDPVGVGARDLTERLLLLLHKLPASHPERGLAITIVGDHLELVASKNFPRLRKLTAASADQLSSALKLITGLNPRIANQFSSDLENYIVPDIVVKSINGEWRAALNPDNQAKLTTNATYAKMLEQTLDADSENFIKDNLAEARTFIKSLGNRYDTLQLVGQAIAERQQAFFDRGESAMQPMVLQDIAATLEMHESTISRATAGKYLLCPRGVYELKFFFSSALGTQDGGSSSSVAIRHLIKQMVDNEPKNKPLSDSKIANVLEQQGHLVARRTVAKYRESLQIAPSSQRKSIQ